MAGPGGDTTPWWREAVSYQVYPRSFADSDGDGVGDLPGITGRLDHLADLGIDALWLSPVTVSPDADWGYDVADYCAVDPDDGTLADLDHLIGAAAERGIRVLLDLVPNHTSVEHPWFVEARSARDSPRRHFYVWADPAPDGGPPNNWVSSFLGPAWTLDPTTGQYYLHNFLPEQPDLDWWNPAVNAEFEKILRFWWDRGVAGFRIDVAHMVVKDAALRPNPPAGPDDHWFERLMGQRQVFNACRPEVHDVYRRWRAVAEEYDPPRLLLGETHVFDLDRVAEFYGDDDELGLAFNFAFMDAPLDPVALRGTPVLYYGDELGLPDTTVPDDRLRDPVTIRFRAVLDRDAARTPMPWTAGPVGGFTAPGVEPRLPLGDVAAVNVADQEADPGSVLRLVRALLRLRRAVPDLRRGDYADLTGALVPDAAAAWTFGRGPTVQVVLNFGASPVEVPVAVTGARLAVSTDRADEGSPIGGSLPVAAGRGVVLVGD